VKLAFQGSSISSDRGLLLHRELDDALSLTEIAVNRIADPRTGKNGRHRLAGLLRQSIFSRLAGYEDVNDADRLCHDPVMRQLVGGRAIKYGAASASAMGRFETAMLTQPGNLAAIADLPGRWIDAVHDRRPPKSITLDMDSSESRCMATRKAPPGTATSNPNACIRSSSSTSSATWSAARSGPATSTALMAGKMF